MLLKFFIAIKDYGSCISKSNFSCSIILCYYFISYRIKNYFMNLVHSKSVYGKHDFFFFVLLLVGILLSL